jgi:hypothetical protein
MWLTTSHDFDALLATELPQTTQKRALFELARYSHSKSVYAQLQATFHFAVTEIDKTNVTLCRGTAQLLAQS